MSFGRTFIKSLLKNNTYDKIGNATFVVVSSYTSFACMKAIVEDNESKESVDNDNTCHIVAAVPISTTAGLMAGFVAGVGWPIYWSLLGGYGVYRLQKPSGGYRVYQLQNPLRIDKTT